jgi:hypothetical protein
MHTCLLRATKGKEYQRRYGTRAARAPSVIWNTGEEYERNGKKHWRCGICKNDKVLAINSGTSSALRHLKQRHKIDKAGQRIQKNPPTVIQALSVAGKVAKTVAHVVTRFNLHYLSVPSYPLGYDHAHRLFLRRE